MAATSTHSHEYIPSSVATTICKVFCSVPAVLRVSSQHRSAICSAVRSVCLHGSWQGAPPPPGFASVFLLLLCLWPRAFAVPLPCLCRVFAVGYPVRAVSLPWFCRVVALLLQCLCKVFVVSCPVLTMSWPWSGAFVPWLCRVVAVFCNVFVVFVAVWLPCRYLSCYCVIAVSLLLLRICCCSV